MNKNINEIVKRFSLDIWDWVLLVELPNFAFEKKDVLEHALSHYDHML